MSKMVIMVMMVIMVRIMIRRRKKVKQPKQEVDLVTVANISTWSILKEIGMAMFVIVIVPSEAPFI